MTERLLWHKVSEWLYVAADGKLGYRASKRDGRWYVKLNNQAIGPKGGFGSFTEAGQFVEWGGTPNRMGYDPETGEVV